MKRNECCSGCYKLVPTHLEGGARGGGFKTITPLIPGGGPGGRFKSVTPRIPSITVIKMGNIVRGTGGRLK